SCGAPGPSVGRMALVAARFRGLGPAGLCIMVLAVMLHHLLALLVHRFHVPGMVLVLLLPGSMVLAVVHSLVVCMGISRWRDLANCWNGKNERKGADNGLHVKISRKCRGSIGLN